jgi:hypothetical protein
MPPFPPASSAPLFQNRLVCCGLFHGHHSSEQLRRQFARVAQAQQDVRRPHDRRLLPLAAAAQALLHPLYYARQLGRCHRADRGQRQQAQAAGQQRSRPATSASDHTASRSRPPLTARITRPLVLSRAVTAWQVPARGGTGWRWQRRPGSKRVRRGRPVAPVAPGGAGSLRLVARDGATGKVVRGKGLGARALLVARSAGLVARGGGGSSATRQPRPGPRVTAAAWPGTAPAAPRACCSAAGTPRAARRAGSARRGRGGSGSWRRTAAARRCRRSR